MTARLMIGDVRKRIREIPDGSVDLVCTSPPFWALRDYGGSDGDTAEMGTEPDPVAFLDALLGLLAEFRRVLAPHGSIAIELGDTYSRKSLCLIPGAFACSLRYGWNVLDRAGADSPAGIWRVRNVIVWARPNPPVGALGDKVRPATSYITVACTTGTRYFDLDAVRTEYSPDMKRLIERGRTRAGADQTVGIGSDWTNKDGFEGKDNGGAPPLDWWEDGDPTGHATIILPTHPYPGAHYATWPPTLARRLVEMMCPLRVCLVCGEPSRRIVDVERTYRMEAKVPKVRNASRNDGGAGPFNHDEIRTTLGWSDCGHNAWRQGHVLDPFCGSGTTIAVAHGCGRDSTGIELYPANGELIAERLGMFLELVV